MSKIKCICFLLQLLLSAIQYNLIAQPIGYIEHYGVEDGLPQNTVMNIVQDQKGMMWFSTWDGLCKFDGYKFTAYKNRQDNPYPMRSNRIDHLMEDKDGYIWTLSYDNEAHRFDPRTETFMGIRLLPGYESFIFTTKTMRLMPSGRVWLISQNDGCISVSGKKFDINIYTREEGKIPSDSVNYIYEDENLNTWILTESGLYVYSESGKLLNDYGTTAKNDRIVAFYAANEINKEVWLGADKGQIFIFNPKNNHFRQLQLGVDKHIKEIKSIDDSRILITTKSSVFFIYNIKNGSVDKFDVSVGLDKNNTENEIQQTYIDRSKRVWIELLRLGATMFDLENKEIYHFSPRLESPMVNVVAPLFIIMEDANNNVWVHPKGGGFSIYDPKTNKLKPFYNDPNSLDWRFSSMLHSAFIDKQNNIWLGTHSKGLDKVVFGKEAFSTIVVDRQAKHPMINNVRSVFESKDGRLWVSTRDGKIHIYDNSRNYLGILTADGRIGHGKPLEGTAYYMMQDDKDVIWIGTKGDGIYRLYDKGNNTFAVKQYLHDIKNPYSLNSNNVYSIFQDSKKRIWVGLYGGGLNLMQDDGKFINYNNLLISYPMSYGSQVRTINEDKFGNICVGTTLGLIMFSGNIDLYNNIDFKFYIKKTGSEISLTANDVYDIVTTKVGDTYFATFGGGIDKIEEVDSKGFPVKFSSVTRDNGLFSDIALQIVEDYEGKLWISSEGNVSVYDPMNKSVKTHSEIVKVVKGYSFTEGSKFVSSTGIIYFGYSNGILVINPHILKSNNFVPYIVLTRFQIHNKDVGFDKKSPLNVSIDYTKDLELSHKQNSFSIEFAATDYAETKQIQYAYMLEGFDDTWVSSPGQRVAVYNNLLPGKYLFRVKSTNSDGIWVNNEHVLPIEIVPSFWQTGWATLLYVLIVSIILFLTLRSLFIYFRLKDKMDLEQEEIEMKTRFFMDISHEIRTPLTMVVSPVENLLESSHTKEEVDSQLRLVLKNANRMLRMVNQILDFRKIEKSKLKIQQTSFGEYVEDISRNFSKTAEIQHVELKVNNLLPDLKLWIDRDNIEKLLFNLLSNAFKHTPTGKRIEVNIYERGKSVALEVKDEGRGMSKEIQSKLFTRFASFNTDKNKPSTGIGLSIVKEIADKHKAQIAVVSSEDKGSVFVIYFQKGRAHFEEGTVEFLPDDNVMHNVNTKTLEESNIDDDAETIGEDAIKEKPSVLIVEDDLDLKKYIVSILEKDYKILDAEDGLQGYEVAVRELPDFILSDIMMPNLDGVGFLQKIKQNTHTSHIPFILLTAKTDMESRLQGLKYGADDYITKPFSVKYLKARINNIIEQRRLLYNTFLGEETISVLTEDSILDNLEIITQEDKDFLKNVKHIIEKNIDNSEFVVEDIANEMLMSRTVFFKKMKSLTGLAPIEFIREVKIKYAAQLIVTTDYTIKEIAFMIGIADSKYFTKWFKAIMNMTPSEYRDKNKHS